MKKLSLLIVLAMVVTVLAGCRTGSSQAPAPSGTGRGSSGGDLDGSVVLTMATAAVTGSPAVQAAIQFADEVFRRSGGKLKIEFHLSGSLGQDTELVQQVMAGTIDLAVVSSGIYSSYTPVLNALQIPFLLNTYEKEYEAVTSPEMRDIIDSMLDVGIKGLAVYESGMRHLCTVSKPIQTPDDMKGLKIRILSNDLMMDTMNALGANPTIMAYSEVYTGLQSNVIDGVDMSMITTSLEKYYEVTKHFSVVGLYPYPFLLSMNPNSFDSLSAEHQTLIQDVATEMIRYNFDLMEEEDEKAKQILVDNGIDVSEIRDVSAFVAKTSDVAKKYSSADPVIQAFVDQWS